MNKMVTLIAFAAAFSVFSTKSLAAIDFSKAMGKATNDAMKAAATQAVKTVTKSREPKGPLKTIVITGIPSEYDGSYAMVMATLLDDPFDVCMPPYLTKGYEGTPVDSVVAGEVKIFSPCDEKKRLITVTFSKVKNDSNATASGYIYAKDSAKDVCKSRAKMPSYKLSPSQTFVFGDFMTNEACQKIADEANKSSKSSKSKK